MGQPHVYEVTLSPKGQVATARCSCGWTEKFRNTASSGPVEDLAVTAATRHAPMAERLTAEKPTVEPVESRNSAPGMTTSSPVDRAPHEYTLTREAGGAVVSRCRCGWNTRFSLSAYEVGQEQDPERMAVEYSERHVAFATQGNDVRTANRQEVRGGLPPIVLPVDRQSSPRRPTGLIVAWTAALIVVAVASTYLLLRPTAGEREAEREANLRSIAIDECDRIARLYDQGLDLPDLRRAHQERFGADSAELGAMGAACPNISRALQNRTASSTPTGPASSPRPSPTDVDSSPSEPSTRAPSATPSEESGTRLSDEADATAALYGYTLPGSAVGEGAALAEVTCERALEGWDYETAVEDDISVGAPREAAVGWNTFVYEEFCPALR